MPMHIIYYLCIESHLARFDINHKLPLTKHSAFIVNRNHQLLIGMNIIFLNFQFMFQNVRQQTTMN